MYPILEKKNLNNNVEEMVIQAPYVARHCEPGQFIILRVDAEGERIPLTIAEYDRKNGTVTIIYQVAGYTTRKLSEKKVGEGIVDFVGPLGQPTEMHPVKRVIGIGGGVGAAPLYPQLKKLSEMGTSVDVILGARNKDLIILFPRFDERLELFRDKTLDPVTPVIGRDINVLAELGEFFFEDNEVLVSRAEDNVD